MFFLLLKIIFILNSRIKFTFITFFLFHFDFHVHKNKFNLYIHENRVAIKNDFACILKSVSLLGAPLNTASSKYNTISYKYEDYYGGHSPCRVSRLNSLISSENISQN